jgi:CHAT domain-containing protein
MFLRRSATAIILTCSLGIISLWALTSSAGNFPPGPPVQVPQSDAGTTLSRGRRLLKQGRADQALSDLQNALTLYTQNANQRGIAAARDALGDLYMVQGQYQVALDYYQKAYDAFSAASKKDQKTQDTAKAVASQAGSTTEAVTDTPASTADNGFNANLMLAKIGDTNFRIGRLSDASASYGRMSVKKPESAKKSWLDRAKDIGMTAAVDQVADGKVTAGAGTAAGFFAAKKEMEQYRVAIVYMTYELGTGRIAFKNKDLELARKHFQNALEAGTGSLSIIANLGQTRRFRTAARTGLGDVELNEGRYKEAAKMFEEAVKGAKDDKRPDLMWPAQRGRGRSLWLQASQEKDNKAVKTREQALAAYREALATIEKIRAGSLRADESRSTFLATTKDVYDEAVSVFADMALMDSPAGELSGPALEYAAAALRISEEGRARSLLDMLAEANAQIREGVPDALLKEKQDNLDSQHDIAARLTGVSLSSDQNQKPSDLEKKLDELEKKYDEIENRIITESPQYAALTANKPLSLADIQQKVLDDNTVLLEYSLGAKISYLFAVTRTGTSVFKLPAKAEIDKLATDLRAQLVPTTLRRSLVGTDVAGEQRGLGLVQEPAANVEAFATASNALYKAAVEPAAKVIGVKRMLIVADGALNYVPFEALVKTPGGTDYASLAFLVKWNEIVYAPSASVIAAIREGGGSTVKASSNVLVVADPIFNADDSRLKGIKVAQSTEGERGLGLALDSAIKDFTVSGDASSASSGRVRLKRLPGTRDEAEEIRKIAQAGGAKPDVWWDLGASEENITGRDVTNYRIVHIATHGFLNVERPQFSGVVLSLVGNTTSDGFLRTDEIFNLKLGSPLVMLSACETGLGKEKRGEGVIGVTRAFMYAGAPTVGVSLWPVDDNSTAELMTDFYRRYLGTGAAVGTPATPVSAAAAMREAQIAMIEGKKYSKPYYWAPFVLVGEWK